MNIDYSEFIKRHRRQVVNYTPTKHGRWNMAIIASIVLLYFTLMIFIIRLAQIDHTTILISIAVFVMASLLAFVARRTQALQKRQEKELILLKEVLEGSRGGRLITDSADSTLYYNQRFKEMCSPLGEELSYAALVGMFSGNNEQVSPLFRALTDQAHLGLTDSIELYCEKRDYEGWYVVTAQPVAGHSGYIHWRLDNVTNRYTADRAVREEREKLIDFTDNAPVGFFSVDEKGHFVFANATFARWLGVDLNDLLKQEKLHTFQHLH